MGNTEMWECGNVGMNEDGERDNEIKHKKVFGELLRSATRISLLRFDGATHPAASRHPSLGGDGLPHHVYCQ